MRTNTPSRLRLFVFYILVANIFADASECWWAHQPAAVMRCSELCVCLCMREKECTVAGCYTECVTIAQSREAIKYTFLRECL